MMQFAVKDRNVALIKKVKECFDAQYNRLPFGIGAKNLLTKQQAELKLKSLDERAP